MHHIIITIRFYFDLVSLYHNFLVAHWEIFTVSLRCSINKPHHHESQTIKCLPNGTSSINTSKPYIAGYLWEEPSVIGEFLPFPQKELVGRRAFPCHDVIIRQIFNHSKARRLQRYQFTNTSSDTTVFGEIWQVIVRSICAKKWVHISGEKKDVQRTTAPSAGHR